MKLKPEILKEINTAKNRLRLAAILGRLDQTISDYIKKNQDHGPLTTYDALNAIREMTGKNYDEILQPGEPIAIK